MLEYNPCVAPLDLPTQELTVRCQAEQPLYLPPRAGATPGTTLWGAFGEVLLTHACVRHARGLGACIDQGAPCLASQYCPVPWLYKPYSRIHRRNLTRPVLLRARALEGQTPVMAFDIEVILWGRHAIAAKEVIEQVIQAMGQAGLEVEGERVCFQVTEIEAAPPLTLAERAAAIRTSAWHEALLVFETPFLHREKVEIEPGVSKKLFMAGGLLPLAEIIGNCAYELAAWDMEDRELGESLDREMRHSLCRQAREAARQAVNGLHITHCNLTPVSMGSRYSNQNGRYFPLMGFTGQVELQGPLEAALPWLLVLALGSGGQKRSMGFGRVQLWWR
jgi:hypothetical protein